MARYFENTTFLRFSSHPHWRNTQHGILSRLSCSSADYAWCLWMLLSPYNFGRTFCISFAVYCSTSLDFHPITPRRLAQAQGIRNPSHAIFMFWHLSTAALILPIKYDPTIASFYHLLAINIVHSTRVFRIFRVVGQGKLDLHHFARTQSIIYSCGNTWLACYCEYHR